MIRGLEFILPNTQYNLMNLFAGIDLDSFEINVQSADIYSETSEFDVPSILNGSQIVTLFQQNTVVISLNLQAYFYNSFKPQSLITYDDFLHSSCEFIFIVVDTTYIEIYAKDDALISRFLENAKISGCSNICVKNENNDGRYNLSMC